MPRAWSPWHLGLAASLALGILPLASGLHSARLFFANKAGQSEAEQLESFKLPWTQPAFRDMVQRLDAVLPEDAALLCTPTGGSDRTGKSRWFLFLADALYPRRVFVRKPALAGGTLMDYPKWIDHHFEVLDTDGSGLGFAGIVKRDELEALERDELRQRGVDWELRFALDPVQPFVGAELLHDGEPVELGEVAP